MGRGEIKTANVTQKTGAYSIVMFGDIGIYTFAPSNSALLFCSGSLKFAELCLFLASKCTFFPRVTVGGFT